MKQSHYIYIYIYIYSGQKRKLLNKTPIYKLNFYFFKIKEKLVEKRATKSFLVRKDNICQSVNIFQIESEDSWMKYTQCLLVSM